MQLSNLAAVDGNDRNVFAVFSASVAKCWRRTATLVYIGMAAV
jgi:hypothetical protein